MYDAFIPPARVVEMRRKNEEAKAAGKRWREYIPGVGIIFHGELSPEEAEEEKQQAADRLTRKLTLAGVPTNMQGANLQTNARGEKIVLIREGEVYQGVKYIHGNLRAHTFCEMLLQRWRPGYLSSRGYNGVVLSSEIFYNPATGNGCGKTWFLSSLIVDFARRGYSVGWTSMAHLLDRYKRAFSHEGGEQSPQQIFEEVSAVDVLMIDELGGEHNPQVQKEEGGGWGRAEFLRLIERRHQENRPTLATTNLPEDDLRAFYEGRAASRLLSRSLFVMMDGPDFRAGQPVSAHENPFD